MEMMNDICTGTHTKQGQNGNDELVRVDKIGMRNDIGMGSYSKPDKMGMMSW